MSGSTPTPDNHKHSDDKPKSHFNKTVCLSDWWLVKVRDGFQGRRLAVAGYPSRGKSGSHAMRVFTSAPIRKRHHDFSIETTDGISVFFEGYINKARTKENGFPSDVYSHFVFGFPPYWREFAEILMDEGSSSVGTSGFTRLKSPSPPRTEFESGQPHVDNCAEDFQSQQKSKKTESPFVSSPEKPDSVSSDPENNLIISGIAPEGLENESYSRGSTVEEDHNILAVMDEVVDDTQVDTSRGVLLACQLHSKSTDDLSKVGLDKINSSLEILSRTEGGARTRSMTNSEMKQKNDKKLARISVGEKIRSNFASSMGPEKPNSVMSDPENNLIISCIAPEGLENESYSRGPTVEEDHNISAVMDEVVDDTQVDTSRGVLLACELHSKSTDDLSKVGLDKINSSLEILSRTEGRARRRSMKNSEMKQKNDKKSARISVRKKIRSNFASSMGPENPDSVISEPENNLIISGIAPEGLENESYSRGPTVEEDHNISAVMDEVVDDTQVDTSRGVLLVCELHSKSTDDLSKVGLDKINSSLEILSRSEGRARTRSMNNSEVKQKNDKKSARISVGEKMRSKFVSSMDFETVEKVAPVGCEPDQGRNNWNFEAFEFHSCTDKKKLSEFGTPKVKNKGNIKKAKTKETRSMGMAAAADNQEDNVTPDMNNVPDNAKSSGLKTRRKLEYQTPDREKVEVASPQCMSFKRSRSGRLLMPTLEFWRNQRAVYGSDRTITGIEEGRINPDPQRKGSTPHRKRR